MIEMFCKYMIFNIAVIIYAYNFLNFCPVLASASSWFGGLFTHLWRACDPSVAGFCPAGSCPGGLVVGGLMSGPHTVQLRLLIQPIQLQITE